MTTEKPCGDQIVESVVAKFRSRAVIGRIKYGVTMDEAQLDFLSWLRHFQEELMDGVNYAEKMIQTIESEIPEP